MKRTILTAVLSAALTSLLFGVFLVHRQDGLVTLPRPFDIHEGDSLDVCRFVCTDYFRAKSGNLQVSISYVQMGEEDAFYQMKLSREEVCYGHLVNPGSHKGEVLNFGSPLHQNPIRFFCNSDSIYIAIDGDTTELYALRSEMY